MKKILSILLVMMTLSLSLYAGGATETEESAATSTGVTEITFLCSSIKPYDTAMPKAIAEFERRNPDIKVKLEQLPTKSIFEVVEVKLGSKEATPDVLFVDAPLVTAYATKGYLAPLDDYFTPAEMNQFVDVCRSYGTVSNTFYAAPFINSSQVLYYNTRMFEEAGLEPLSKDPEDRLTWKELIEIAAKLTTDKDNDGTPEVFGLGIAQISRPYQMLSMPLSLGGESIGKDGLSVKGILTTDAWVEACQFFQDIYNRYNVSPKGVTASDMLAYFVSEKVAMLIGPDYNHLAYSKNPELTWDYAPYPYFEDGKPVTPTGSWAIGINSASKHKDAAARLVRFLTTDEYCVEWFKMDGHLPSNKATLEYIASNSDYQEWPFNIFTLLNYEAENTAVSRPLTPGYLEYESMLTSCFEDIRNGADVLETLRQTEVKIDRALQKYR